MLQSLNKTLSEIASNSLDLSTTSSNSRSLLEDNAVWLFLISVAIPAAGFGIAYAVYKLCNRTHTPKQTETEKSIESEELLKEADSERIKAEDEAAEKENETLLRQLNIYAPS